MTLPLSSAKAKSLHTKYVSYVSHATRLHYQLARIIAKNRLEQSTAAMCDVYKASDVTLHVSSPKYTNHSHATITQFS